MERESNEHFDGRVKFNIPLDVKAYSSKKSDRTIDGLTYKTYLATRPASQTETNGSRRCTRIRGIIENVNQKVKRDKLIRETWHHSKIQSQVRL